MANYKVKITSGDPPVTTEYPFSSLEYQRSFLIDPKPFVVKIPIIETTPIQLLDIVEIYRDNELVTKGNITVITKISDMRGTQVELKGVDLKRKLALLKVPSISYNNIEPAQQVRDQLPNTGLTESNFVNYGSGISMDYGSTDPAAFERRRAILEICTVIGHEFFASPLGGCVFKAPCGVDRSATIIFKRGELIRSWVEPYKKDASHKVKKITVLGKGIGDIMTYGIAQTPDYAAGDPEKTINHKNLIDANTCQKAAATHLADFKNDVEYGCISIIDTYVGCAYDVFDKVTIVDDQIGVNGAYRICGITRTFDSETGETTEIEFTNITKLNANGETLIKTGESLLGEGITGAEDFSQTGMGEAAEPNPMSTLYPSEFSVGLTMQMVHKEYANPATKARARLVQVGGEVKKGSTTDFKAGFFVFYKKGSASDLGLIYLGDGPFTTVDPLGGGNKDYARRDWTYTDSPTYIHTGFASRSIKEPATPVPSYGLFEIYRTGTWNLSNMVYFYFAIKETMARDFRVKLQTSAGNYFYKDLSVGTSGNWIWREWLLSDFTTYGSPSWSNITKITFECTGPSNLDPPTIIWDTHFFSDSKLLTYWIFENTDWVEKIYNCDVLCANNEGLNVYWVILGGSAGNLTYLRYARLDVRGIGYLMDVAEA